MKKRILSLFLCLVLCFSLAACDGEGAAGSDSDPATSSQSTTKTETNSKTDETLSSDEDPENDVPKKKGFDSSIEHKIIATDILSHGIVIFDLNACGGDFQKLTDDNVSVVWEWDPEEDPNCKGIKKIGTSISGVKYRYSEYYKKDVIVACATYGWVGIIDYETRSVLWESTDPILYGVHSVEMLPNGDVVAGAGAVVYFAVSQGIDSPVSSVNSPSCHGVCWDPVNECLWVLEYAGVVAIGIVDMETESPELVRIDRSGASFGQGNGHAFSPVYGEPGKYWASSGSALWQFGSEDETMISNYPLNAFLTRDSIKGIASFSDGTVVETVGGIGPNSKSWSSAGFLIIWQKPDTDEVQAEYVLFKHRDFYKVQPFTKDYQ